MSKVSHKKWSTVELGPLTEAAIARAHVPANRHRISRYTSFAIEGSEAVIRYRGVNRAQEPIFAAHLVTDAHFKIYANAAYCALSPDERHVNLILGDSPLPCDREVEFGVGAASLKLLQGEAVSGELRLAVPLEEWSAYFVPHRAVKTEIVAVRQVVLHVEVVPESAVAWIRPARAAPDHWSVDGPLTRYSLEFFPDALLPVARRSGGFSRR